MHSTFTITRDSGTVEEYTEPIDFAEAARLRCVARLGYGEHYARVLLGHYDYDHVDDGWWTGWACTCGHGVVGGSEGDLEGLIQHIGHKHAEPTQTIEASLSIGRVHPALNADGTVYWVAERPGHEGCAPTRHATRDEAVTEWLADYSRDPK